MPTLSQASSETAPETAAKPSKGAGVGRRTKIDLPGEEKKSRERDISLI